MRFLGLFRYTNNSKKVVWCLFFFFLKNCSFLGLGGTFLLQFYLILYLQIKKQNVLGGYFAL